MKLKEKPESREDDIDENEKRIERKKDMAEKEERKKMRSKKHFTFYYNI